jgi:SAM-dependent methyltransferase
VGRVKRFVKWLVRPIARPILARLDQRYQTGDIAHYLPLVLNAIATQNATAREFERAKAEILSRLGEHEARLLRIEGEIDPRIAEHNVRLAGLESSLEQRLAHHDEQLAAVAEALGSIEQRAEFIRREVMYEARFGAGSRGVEYVEPTPVNLEMFKRNGPLRLNLGSGHVPRDGYVNVDARDLEGVDVVADVRRLPFEPGTVDEIYSSHLVEHFPVEELRRVVLPHWLALLRPGGRIVAVTPDAEAMVVESAAGRMSFEDLARVTFGDQEYDGDYHFAMFTPDSLATLLADVGYGDVAVVECGRRNGLCYEFEINAVRPVGETAMSDATPGR